MINKNRKQPRSQKPARTEPEIKWIDQLYRYSDTQQSVLYTLPFDDINHNKEEEP